MPIGWAILGASVIGAGSSLLGANAQADAANNASQLQYQQYQQTRQDYAPWRETGIGALGEMNALMGLGGGYSGGNALMAPQQQAGPTPGMIAAQATGTHSKNGVTHGLGGFLLDGGAGLFRTNASPIQDIAGALKNGTAITDAQWAQAGYGPGGSDPNGQGNTAPGSGGLNPGGEGPLDAAARQQNAFANFRATPGYQFALDEGQKGVERSAAARGILNSGATAKALTRYGQGLADQTYANYFARLQSLAGLGQTATGSTANAGANYANGAGNALMAGGAARASAYGDVGTAANRGIQNYLAYSMQQNQPMQQTGSVPWTANTPFGQMSDTLPYFSY